MIVIKMCNLSENIRSSFHFPENHSMLSFMLCSFHPTSFFNQVYFALIGVLYIQS